MKVRFIDDAAGESELCGDGRLLQTGNNGVSNQFQIKGFLVADAAGKLFKFNNGDQAAGMYSNYRQNVNDQYLECSGKIVESFQLTIKLNSVVASSCFNLVFNIHL